MGGGGGGLGYWDEGQVVIVIGVCVLKNLKGKSCRRNATGSVFQQFGPMDTAQ